MWYPNVYVKCMQRAWRFYIIIIIFVLKLNLQQDTENYKKSDFYKLPHRDIGTDKLEERQE